MTDEVVVADSLKTTILQQRPKQTKPNDNKTDKKPLCRLFYTQRWGK